MFTKPTLPTTHGSEARRTQRAGPDSAQLNSRIRALQTQVSGLEGEIRALRESTSWRMSAPIRWLRRQLNGRKSLLDPASIRRSESYAEWARLYDLMAEGEADRFCVEMATRAERPVLSVVMVASSDGLPRLASTVNSILLQAYQDREMVIALERGDVPRAEAILPSKALKEGRIKLHPCRPGFSKAEALNSALGTTSGDWIVLLEPGDVLPRYALCHVAAEIHSHADARIVYSDEDTLDDQGGRIEPLFKPDWNVELFYSQNLASHLAVFSKGLLGEVDGFREDAGAAAVYDLVLRSAERLRPMQIRHIPRVLCHRPQGDDGVLSSATAEAEAKALTDHFLRIGTAARVLDTENGRRVHFELPLAPPLVSLIIPTRNGLDLVRQCIESIVTETTYPNYEILLVDNGSDDPAALGYFGELQKQPGITVIRDDRPFNYSALNNQAVRRARGEVIGLINNDIEVIAPEWLSEMVSIALQPGVGAVGAKLLYPDETVQHGGVLLGVGGATGIASHAHKFLSAWDPGYMNRSISLQSFSAVTAACLVVRKSAYEQVGGLNEAELKVAYNDVDFCLKLLEAGYRNVWTPHAQLFHHESATRGSDFSPERSELFDQEQAYMRSRWGALIANDPAYNPNLTVYAEDFGLAWPPRVPWVAGAAKP